MPGLARRHVNLGPRVQEQVCGPDIARLLVVPEQAVRPRRYRRVSLAPERVQLRPLRQRVALDEKPVNLGQAVADGRWVYAAEELAADEAVHARGRHHVSHVVDGVCVARDGPGEERLRAERAVGEQRLRVACEVTRLAELVEPLFDIFAVAAAAATGSTGHGVMVAASAVGVAAEITFIRILAAHRFEIRDVLPRLKAILVCACPLLCFLLVWFWWINGANAKEILRYYRGESKKKDVEE
ncbi:hypothetical protein AAL_05142 [Moelleriella libera RCEF 2490]|uniref:Uncharacterized protein n=1 Tax=Moelleriella libera RCEF 2490 TaxID=1081109 RepID=A0A168APE8_9HYPO|nr:hypothetical protein AAL_05142 [Moelleriella libera RCEF 2490]